MFIYEQTKLGPLFYEALSGEFTPHSAPDTSHTLGKLLIATLAKGKPDNNRSYFETNYVNYRPSWAPDVESTVHIGSNGLQHPNVHSLKLTRDDGSILVLNDHTEISTAPRSVISVSFTGELEPHEQISATFSEIDVTRRAVTKLAQEFFSKKTG